MTLTIEKINANEHFEYKGDVRVTGSVGKNATVIIKDGNLTIDGNIEDKSEVRLVQEPNNNVVVTTGVFFMNSVSIGGSTTGKILNVKGDIGNSVTLSSHNAEFSIDGNVGESCRFKTHNGGISCGNVGNNSSLQTHNGGIHAGNLGENCRATSHNGSVHVAYAPKSAEVETHNGNVYENGVKRKKEKSRNQGNVISVGNMSFIGGDRIIVNGKDITDLVNGTNSSAKVQQNEPPVRYTKR